MFPMVNGDNPIPSEDSESPQDGELTLQEAVLQQLELKIKTKGFWYTRPGWQHLGHTDGASCPENGCSLEYFLNDSGLVNEAHKEAFVCKSCGTVFKSEEIDELSDPSTSAYGVLKKDYGLEISPPGQTTFGYPGWEADGNIEGDACSCGGGKVFLLRRHDKPEKDIQEALIREKAYACRQCLKIFGSSELGPIYVDSELDGESDEGIKDLGPYHSYYRKTRGTYPSQLEDLYIGRLLTKIGGVSTDELFWFEDNVSDICIDEDSKPRHTSRILSVKEEVEEAIKVFASMIDKLLHEDVSVARVPSHDPANSLGGIGLVAAIVASKNRRRRNATACLKRRYKVEPKSIGSGRKRSIKGDLDSIEVDVRQKQHIDLKNVLLIDDVTTTGDSLIACRELLLRAGAQRVKMLALGKTFKAT